MRNNRRFIAVKVCWCLMVAAQILGGYSGAFVRQLIDLELLMGVITIIGVLLLIEGVANSVGTELVRALGANFALGIIYGELYHLYHSKVFVTDVGFLVAALAICFVFASAWQVIDLIFESELELGLQPSPILEAWAGAYLGPILLFRVLVFTDVTFRKANIASSGAVRLGLKAYRPY